MVYNIYDILQARFARGFKYKEEASMTVYKNLSLGSERALYAIKDAEVENCVFAGAEDGKSALKECSNVKVRNSVFELRYPLWHLKGGFIENCKMTESCRAA